jgi:alpha-1,6-mannosyltransferase
MAYLFQRHEFATLFATYAVSFLAYLMALKQTKNESDLNFFLIIAIILRGCILFAFPNLSDDIYRFIWDGHLIALGENPFNHLPRYYIENQLFTDVLTPELFAKLNSPNYFSVYPSVCQGVFFMAVSIFPKSIYGATIVIKSFLFLCEIGTLFLLKKLSFNSNCGSPNLRGFVNLAGLFPIRNKFNAPLIYGLNPLIILELVGNVHFEAAMIFFFLLGIFILKELKFILNRKWFSDFRVFIYLRKIPSIFLRFCSNLIKSKHSLRKIEGIFLRLIRNSRFNNESDQARATVKVAPTNDVEETSTVALALVALAWSLSISAKLLTIMLLPLVWRQLGWKRSIQLWLFVVVTSLLLFLPIYTDLFIPNIMTSLKLYSNKFEFNASLFYLIQGFFYWQTGWNKIQYITPYLTGFVILFIIKKSFFNDLNKNMFKELINFNKPLIAFNTEVFFESCLFVLMIYFACATTVHPWYAAMPLACSVLTRWRFPMVWTFTIFLTYHGYTEGSSKHTESFVLVAVEYLAVVGWFLFELKNMTLKFNI